MGYDFEVHKITFFTSLLHVFPLLHGKSYTFKVLLYRWIEYIVNEQVNGKFSQHHYIALCIFCLGLLCQSKLCNSTYKWCFLLQITLLIPRFSVDSVYSRRAYRLTIILIVLFLYKKHYITPEYATQFIFSYKLLCH